MRRRAPLALAFAALLLAVLPDSAKAVSIGVVLSLIRQELVRYGLLDSAGAPVALSSVTTTGDALSGTGTSGDPLAAASDLENLVDTATVDASGNATLTGRAAAPDYSGGIATLSTLVSISLAAGTAATRTITVSNDCTGSGAVSVDTAGLSASQTRSVKIVLTVSGTRSFSWDSSWTWTKAVGGSSTKPSSLVDGTYLLWIESHGSTAADIEATIVELGS